MFNLCYSMDNNRKRKGINTMIRTGSAMIHSLNEVRTVQIISETDNNHVTAKFNGKTCNAINNPFNGIYYVDDIYGVISDDYDKSI